MASNFDMEVVEGRHRPAGRRCLIFIMVFLILALAAAIGCAIYFGLKSSDASESTDLCSYKSCDHKCREENNMATCLCNTGYALAEDQTSCTDIDECSTGTHDCGHSCTNTLGGYNCTCTAGHILDNNKKTCTTACEVSQAPVVNTAHGSIQGKTVTQESTGTVVNTFLNIPFAAPPVGEFRWKAPQDPEAWNDTLQCTQQGSLCMQDPPAQFAGWKDYSEDCLNLNVYVPVCAKPGSTPVMVSIFGGGFMNGGNVAYNGHFLAGMHNVVVVVPNYRVNVFGFISTEDSVSPGNYGLMDQMKALEWVRDNIAAFGGDPNTVTIFGESAGAASVGYMLLSPLAEGLYHRAIYESGTETSPFALVEKPRNGLLAVANAVQCPTSSSADIMDCLNKIDADTLRNVSSAISAALGTQQPMFIPCVDGTVVPDNPAKMRKEGKFSKVPIIMGLNEQESFAYTPLTFPESGTRGVSRSEFTGYMTFLVNSQKLSWPPTTDAKAVLEAIKFQYTYWPDPLDPMWNRYMFGKYYDDFDFTVPANDIAKIHSQAADTFFFVYDYTSEGSTLPDWMGAVHAIELESVFGDPYAALEFPASIYDDSDREMSTFVMTLWTNFAKYGNPTPEPVYNPINKKPITWQQFRAPGNLTYIYIGRDDVANRENYRQQYTAFWQYYKWLVHGEELA